MRQFIIILSLFFIACLSASANDGVYYMSGNQLVPMEETDISVVKEILTIHLGDDGMADVDVYYEFRNDGPEKHILMGFEADAPYNASANVNAEGLHPYMHAFSVIFNGQVLPFSNGVYASNIQPGAKPLDLKLWKDANRLAEEGSDESIWETELYNASLDSVVSYSYVYKFDATFRPGLNVVHHTYRYNTSMSVCTVFGLQYKLSPATRWANHRIDDFTLRITAQNTAKHFVIYKDAFAAHPFVVTAGAGKVRESKNDEDTYYEVSLRNGVVEWHADNFCPADELSISSADVCVLNYNDDFVLGAFYDRSANYYPELCHSDVNIDKRILRNLPYAHRGYVFKDKALQKYFSQFWWYMPDPEWKTSNAHLTEAEEKRLWQLEYGESE